MRKNRWTAYLLIFVVLVLSIPTVSALGSLPQTNDQPRHEVCTTLSEAAEDYYADDYSYKELSALRGASDISTSYAAMQDNPLFTTLHDLMANTHQYSTTYSGYNKGSLAYFWNSTDAVGGSDTYIMFYSDMPGNIEGVTLNREHVWPKSRASFYQKNGGADLHHLRPSVSSVNQAKSNHTFGNIDGVLSEGYTQRELNGEVCYRVSKSADLFECKDDVKGDVARILLYVYCRWEQPNLYTDTPSDELPELDADDDANSGVKVIESLDTLLEWCEQDPVDTWEMRRNDLTQEVQGNRNVFIDYPELAWQLFSQEIPTDMSTPTSISRKSILGDADGDGEVTVLDVTAIQRYLVLLKTFSFDETAADVDQDEAVTILDATYIQRSLAGLLIDDNAE